MRFWIFCVALFCTSAFHAYAVNFDDADLSNQDEAISEKGCPDGSKASVESTNNPDELVSAIPDDVNNIYAGDPSRPDDLWNPDSNLDTSNGLAQKHDYPDVALNPGPDGIPECPVRMRPLVGKERLVPFSSLDDDSPAIEENYHKRRRLAC